MNIRVLQGQNRELAVVDSDEVIITDVQSALDLIATIAWETGHSTIILPKSAIIEEFFDLKTRLAGEILQKFTNYDVRFGIVGDFTQYSSKSLQDFIFESNKGRRICFVSSEEEALALLG